jgi:hypothetical protein
LSEWWNEAAYMGYRDSIVPNVNYFYLHKKGSGKGVGRTRRGAELIRGVRAFRELLVRYVARPCLTVSLQRKTDPDSFSSDLAQRETFPRDDQIQTPRFIRLPSVIQLVPNPHIPFGYFPNLPTGDERAYRRPL